MSSVQCTVHLREKSSCQLMQNTCGTHSHIYLNTCQCAEVRTCVEYILIYIYIYDLHTCQCVEYVWNIFSCLFTWHPFSWQTKVPPYKSASGIITINRLLFISTTCLKSKNSCLKRRRRHISITMV